MVGIVGYGTYIPRWRIPVSEIAGVWGKNPDEITGSLGVWEKSVPSVDEDAVTLAVEAASSALGVSGVAAHDVGALFVGSESHPYAVNPTSTIVGEMLDVGTHYLAADLEFACKAATAGMQAVTGLISAGQIRYGMTIGSDTAQSKPHDVLEYASAAASAAYILGDTNVAVELEAYTSYSSDTPDFWRRDGIRFPSHAGRFTGEPAYFTHVTGAAKALMQQVGVAPKDADWCVFHMPNGKFPRAVARRLGFTEAQLAPSLIVDTVGNPYSASVLLGLAAVLDQAKPGQRIFMVSYGSGAGSDAFLWRTTRILPRIAAARRESGQTVSAQIGRKRHVGYAQYLRQTHKI